LYLSARHVKLYYNEGEWYIVDLKSTNGTYINGIKMGKKQLILDSEDKIRIGQLEFLVVLE
jgi:pSer/pThr/pTyr-binding forkhead associated (FHA) protein